MPKQILFDKRAQKELKNFSKRVQTDFLALIQVLKELGRLEPPEAKKVGPNLFEMRVSSQGTFRGFYAYVWQDHIIILHFFQKKTQKTPLKNLKLAKQRLHAYE